MPVVKQRLKADSVKKSRIVKVEESRSFKSGLNAEEHLEVNALMRLKLQQREKQKKKKPKNNNASAYFSVQANMNESR
jgi:hypothetical protein